MRRSQIESKIESLACLSASGHSELVVKYHLKRRNFKVYKLRRLDVYLQAAYVAALTAMTTDPAAVPPACGVSSDGGLFTF